MNSNNSKDDRLSVFEIGDYEQLLDIRDAWDELLPRLPRSSVFFTFEWIDAAWQWRKANSRLKVFFCNRNGNTVSIAPLCVSKQVSRLVQFNELSLIEVPDTQECDVLAMKGFEEASVRALLRSISGQKDWDVAVLPKLETGSILLTQMPALIDEVRIKWEEVDAGCNQEVVLDRAWSDYYATRSRRLKKGNNNIRNKINASAEKVEVRWFGADRLNDEEAREISGELRRVSEQSWKKSTRLTLNEDGPGAFIDRLFKYAREKNWLSYWDLALDDVVVATEFQLNYQGTVAALRADYDIDFRHLSPGTFLNWRIIESLFDSDCVLYRMGPGSNEYKLRWSEQISPLREIRLYNRTLRGRYLWIVDTKLVPIVRRLRSGFAAVYSRARAALSSQGK